MWATTVIEFVDPRCITTDNCWFFSLNQLCTRRDTKQWQSSGNSQLCKPAQHLELLCGNR